MEPFEILQILFPKTILMKPFSPTLTNLSTSENSFKICLKKNIFDEQLWEGPGKTRIILHVISSSKLAASVNWYYCCVSARCGTNSTSCHWD